jgi:hypothetical protein
LDGRGGRFSLGSRRFAFRLGLWSPPWPGRALAFREHAEQRVDLDGLAFLGEISPSVPADRRRNLERHLVGFQFDQRLVRLDGIARLLEPLPMVASVTDSPSVGTRISFAINPDPSLSHPVFAAYRCVSHHFPIPASRPAKAGLNPGSPCQMRYRGTPPVVLVADISPVAVEALAERPA